MRWKLTKKRLIELLEKEDTFNIKYGCHFCHSDIENPSFEGLSKLIHCNNCLLDIEALGQWSGDGWAYLKSLYKQYNDDARMDKLLDMLVTDLTRIGV